MNNHRGSFGTLLAYYMLFFKMTAYTKDVKKWILSDILLTSVFRNFSKFPL